MKSINPIGKFTCLSIAESFANRTEKPSAVILGDDEKYWVVTLRDMNRALIAGYEIA